MDGQEHPKPGSRIRQYELLSELGRGGMGVVFRARDTELGRDVALKSPLLPEGDDEGVRRRFLKEARAAARLSHPNVVQLFEVFVEGDRPWLVMQLVPGEDLRDRLRDGRPLPLTQALRIGEDLCAALHAAHTEGILHRDVSPKNVLLSEDERAMLTDFGLARFTARPDVGPDGETVSLETAEGVLIGTPHYMSPEQCMGRALDERTDVYALGAVLYHTCTGRSPYEDLQFPALLEAIVHREPPPPTRLNYELPEELERIIRKAMAKSPDERYQSVKELQIDLRTLRRRQDFRAYSDTHPGLAVEAPKRVRRVARALPWLVGLAVAIALGALLWWPRSGSRPATVPHGTSFQVTSGREWEGEPALSPDGGRIAYVSDVSGNDDVLVTDVGGGRAVAITNDPAQDRQPAWVPDGSGVLFASNRTGAFAIWRAGPFGGGETLVVTDARMPAVSPDGRTLAFARVNEHGSARIFVAPMDDPTAAVAVTSDDDGEWDHEMPAWSPDGGVICYAAHQNLWVVSATGGDARPLTTGGELDREPAWAPDGRHVYFASHREGTLALWRVPIGGGAPQRVTLGTGPERDPYVSRDGTRLVYCTSNPAHDVVLLNRTSGSEEIVSGARDFWMPTIDDAGTRVAYVSDRSGRLEVWCANVTNGHFGEHRRITDQPGAASHPSLSPDGRWIVYYRTIDGGRDLWCVPSGGGRPTPLTTHAEDDLHPAWSPDGRHVAFVSERSGSGDVWRMPVSEGQRAGEPTPVTHGGVTAVAPVWSPDGTRIAFANLTSGGVEAWVVEASGTSAPVAVWTESDVLRVGWDPTNGDLLVSGTWGDDEPSLRRVSTTATPFDARVNFGYGGGYGYERFALTKDATLLVYCRSRLQGDVWRLDLDVGTY